MPTPYTGTSSERLTELINTDNGTSLVAGTDFTFGSPTELTGDENYNSTITLIAPDGSDKVDTAVKYNRLPISDVTDSLDTPAELEIESFPFSIKENLPLLNTVLGLDLTEEEVEDTVYTEPDVGNTYTITITDSLAWLPGSSINFTGNYTEPDPEP